MRRAIRACVQLAARTFAPTGPVVEIGAYHPANRASLADLRPLFPGLPYCGCDIRPGPGVDRVEDAHALTFGDRSTGTLLMLETLEHLPFPQRAVAEARRVLVDDGLLIVSVPFSYRLHGYPADYWRFTAAGMQVLLGGFDDALIFSVGPRLKPAFVFAVATPIASASFSQAKQRYRAAVTSAFTPPSFRARWSAFKERARDLAGLVLGRADLSVDFLDSDRQ